MGFPSAHPTWMWLYFGGREHPRLRVRPQRRAGLDLLQRAGLGLPAHGAHPGDPSSN
jgi:hypothetical protein